MTTFEWLVAHGVVFVDKAPDARGGNAVGNSVPREMHAAAMAWPMVQTGRPVDPEVQATTSTGNGLMRPLEVAAKRAGVRILLEHRMTAIHREAPAAGRVLGIGVRRGVDERNIRARKSVIIATGGSQGNLEFRRMFDPRLTEEYCGLAGMPWSDQDASGELAAMEVGAVAWGLTNQAGEFGWPVTKPGLIGCQYNYTNLQWMPGSPVFHKARASGLRVTDWQNVILVNMLGRRFYDETGSALYLEQLWFGRSVRTAQLPQREEPRIQSQQLAQRRIGRSRRNAQRWRSDLGDLRRGRRRT